MAKKVTITVSIPDGWTEQDATNFFQKTLEQAQKRAIYNKARNAEFKAFREAKKAGKLPK